MTIALVGSSALVPALLLLWYLYSRDANPEPKGVVRTTFLLGALICIPVVPVALALESLGAGLGGVWTKAAVSAFLGAAIPEECFKFLVLRGYAYRQPAFDEPMDGIVYGATASLGFAALENLLYVADGGTGVAALRALTAVPGHAFTGVLMGYYVGRAKFEDGTGLALRGLVLAILLHGLYDAFLLSGTGYALLGLVVLGLELWLGRRAIAHAHEAQLAHRVASLTARGGVVVAAVAVQSGPGYVQAVAVEAVRPPRALRHRSVWAQVKLVVGGVGASVGALVLLLLAGTWLDGADDEVKLGLVILAVIVGLPTLGAVAVFRSGLRGPFVEA